MILKEQISLLKKLKDADFPLLPFLLLSKEEILNHPNLTFPLILNFKTGPFTTHFDLKKAVENVEESECVLQFIPQRHAILEVHSINPEEKDLLQAKFSYITYDEKKIAADIPQYFIYHYLKKESAPFPISFEILKRASLILKAPLKITFALLDTERVLIQEISTIPFTYDLAANHQEITPYFRQGATILEFDLHRRALKKLGRTIIMNFTHISEDLSQKKNHDLQNFFTAIYYRFKETIKMTLTLEERLFLYHYSPLDTSIQKVELSLNEYFQRVEDLAHRFKKSGLLRSQEELFALGVKEMELTFQMQDLIKQIYEKMFERHFLLTILYRA